MRSAAAGIAVCACLAWSCNRVREAPAAVAATSTPAAAPATGVPHGDHNPRHGGVVFMDGDLHFEVVLGRDGQHRLYFSDAMREELPAATASAVTAARAGSAADTRSPIPRRSPVSLISCAAGHTSSMCRFRASGYGSRLEPGEAHGHSP